MKVRDMLKGIVTSKVKRNLVVEKGCGTPVFNERDIGNTTHILAKLLRAILVHQEVSVEELIDNQRQFLTANGIERGKFSSARMNIIAAYSRSRVTFTKFHEILVGIQGYDMDIEVTIKNHDGKTTKYKYSDIVAKNPMQ